MGLPALELFQRANSRPGFKRVLGRQIQLSSYQCSNIVPSCQQFAQLGIAPLEGWASLRSRHVSPPPTKRYQLLHVPTKDAGHPSIRDRSDRRALRSSRNRFCCWKYHDKSWGSCDPKSRTRMRGLLVCFFESREVDPIQAQGKLLSQKRRFSKANKQTAMGQNPAENIPIPTKIGSKMGGAPTPK